MPRVDIILEKLKGKSKDEDKGSLFDSMSEDKEESGLDVAAEELMDAFHSKDVEALKEALCSFIEQYDSE